MFGAIFRGIGSCFEFSFNILKFLGNFPNLLIILALTFALGWWLVQLKKFGAKDTPLEKKEGREIQ